QIRIDHLPPLFRSDLADVGKQANCRIVDEDINAAKTLCGKYNQVPHLLQIADITNRTGNLTFSFCRQLSDATIDVRLVSRTNHYLHSLLQQAAGNRFSDAFRSARNNCHLILDSVHEVLAFLFQSTFFTILETITPLY